ncbi:fumarylacetoacetate hydrolase [Dyadobacter sp. SG02]|uniref:fumarylacetoacetase n=1 Tax=Dyadobacter sp. SG02 TaxID=1855291 RepID=UPI0008C16AC7|nr:fumarylacetoacetase [Dyadobacter sp. SG02]SEJ64991.1 fumarylacetoacetate hydrolase [Dyadobacter sp. SG02]
MLQSWLPIPPDSDFSIHNLPFGIFSDERPARAGLAIGDWVVDLAAAYALNMFPHYPEAGSAFRKPVLNELVALGRGFSDYVRNTVQTALCDSHSDLKQFSNHLLIPQKKVQMHMPLKVGNYTDFYSSEEHAFSVGQLFRPENPLFPNWKHLPVAYHGRASSIVVSGTPVPRPWGQIGQTSGIPAFKPTNALDYELELAFVIGKDSAIGRPVSIAEAEDYIFGMVLFNDWSARDIQRWEYQPLGPFTSKNFASGISPWVVTWEALQHFRVPAPPQEPEPLPYLVHQPRQNFDLCLSVSVKPHDGQEVLVCNNNASGIYWTIAQQIAHHTVTGCNLQTGDLLATGTISGKEISQKGCLLEATLNGTQPITLHNGVGRRFLEDHDEVIMHGFGQKGDIRVGFGELRGKVLPAVR